MIVTLEGLTLWGSLHTAPHTEATAVTPYMKSIILPLHPRISYDFYLLVARGVCLVVATGGVQPLPEM